MKLKMALLEQAHGLLCNAPGTGHGARTDPEAVAEWERLRAQWISQWEHVIRAQQVKEHNHATAIENSAITWYQDRQQEAAGTAPDVPSGMRVVEVPGVKREGQPLLQVWCDNRTCDYAPVAQLLDADEAARVASHHYTAEHLEAPRASGPPIVETDS